MSGSPPFVHLHLHSEYSLLDGAIRFEKLAPYLRENGMNTVAVTDHGSLYGAVHFSDVMAEHGVHPIVGMEAYVASGSRLEKSDDSREGTRHLTLLAADEEGYRNLCRLSSIGWTEGFYRRPRIDRETLARHSRGLVIGSACLQGEIAYHISRGRKDLALEAVRFYQDLVGRERFFIELMDHGLPEEKAILPGLAELARETGALPVATNDAHYLVRDHAGIHDILLCLQTKKTLSDPGRMKLATEEFYVKTPEEMARLFSWIPEAVTNTVEVARQCTFSLGRGGFLLPDFPLPPGEESLDLHLRSLAEAGLSRKLGREPDETERRRLTYELDVICDMGFPGYFLIVSELTEWARSRGIPLGPGRGSAAGSLVSWAIGITEVNPLKYGLSFERFLNPARKQMPDIDMDVCYERRGEVIAHIVEKYGQDRVCQIISFNRMKNRAAIRDVSRVMGMPFETGDRLSKLLATAPDQDAPLDVLAKQIPELAREAEEDPEVARLIRYCGEISGVARHSGVHAAGVVITPGPLMDYVPLCFSREKGLTTQFEMKSAEKIGLMKLDVLGLRTVTVLRHAEEMVRRRQPSFSVEGIPLDDPATLDLLNRVETIGVFQLESPGMRDALRKIGVDRFDDVTAAVAIFRPGSMHMIDLYGENKRRAAEGKPAKDMIPELQDVLGETHGVIVYQEQVMEIAHSFAGMSMAEADSLRRAISKKNAREMESFGAAFISGARSRGVSERKAREIFDHIRHFGEYGFNKSHSVCYAIIAYWTAYLKAHFPGEFMAATMTSEMGSTERLAALVAEAGRMGLTVLPPSVNDSLVTFDVDREGRIVYALKAVKNVGESPALEIVAARNRGGAFTGIQDLACRVESGLNKKVLESLIIAGALDSLPGKRSAMLASVDRVLAYATAFRKHREAGQMTLFGAESMAEPEAPPLQEMEEIPREEMLRGEKELLGFYLTGHPLDEYREEVRAYATHSPGAVAGYKGARPVSVAALVDQLRFRDGKRGRIAFLTLSGVSDSCEATVWPESLEKCAAVLGSGKPLLFTGRVQNGRGEPRFCVEKAEPLEEIRKRSGLRLRFTVTGEGLPPELFTGLVALLGKHPGNAPVFVEMECEGTGRRYVGESRSIRVATGGRLLEELRRHLGDRASVSLYNGGGVY